MNPTLLACTALVLASSSPAQSPERRTTLTGDIRHHKGFESKVLGNKRNLIVYIPPAYDLDRRRTYPVVYMHDGQNVFDGATSYIPNGEWRADEAAEALIRAGLLEPLIIVGIDNAGVERANEYLPTKASMGNGGPVGGRADDYGRMITDEVMPFIEGLYRVKKGPQNTGLIGSSFGGVVTLHLGLTRPTVFGKLGVVSPSLWWDGRTMIRSVENLKRKLPLKIWLDMGTEEGGGHSLTTDLAQVLKKKGWKSPQDFVYYEDGFARHNEAAWSQRIGLMLLYLFPASKS